jgi:hypothetical protein
MDENDLASVVLESTVPEIPIAAYNGCFRTEDFA